MNGRPEYVRLGVRRVAAAARCRRTSTSTTSTAPTPRCPSRRPSARWPSWSPPARCATSACPRRRRTRSAGRSRCTRSPRCRPSTRCSPRHRGAVLPACRELGIALVAVQPARPGPAHRHGRGASTTCTTSTSAADAAALPGREPGAQRRRSSTRVASIADAHGCTPAQVALAWLAARRARTSSRSPAPSASPASRRTWPRST